MFVGFGLSANHAEESGHLGTPEGLEPRGRVCEDRHRRQETRLSQLLAEVHGEENEARIPWAWGLGKGD